MTAKRLPEVVAAGDRRKSLELMRDAVAERLDASEGRDAAPLSKELREILRELEQLPTGEEVSTSDELAARRAARLAEAATAERPAESQ